MPTATYNAYPRGRSYTPQMSPQAQAAYIQAQRDREQAAIAARALESNRAAQQRAALEEAKMKAREDLAKAQRAAQFSALTTGTNSTWNKLMSEQAFKEKQAANKPDVEFTDSSDPALVVKRKMTSAAFERYKAQKDFDKKITELTDERAVQADKYFGRGKERVAAIDKELAALKASPPANLLAPQDIVDAPAAAPLQTRSPAVVSGVSSMTGPGWAPTQGTGIIGTPERNSFINESTPLGMNRAQATDWAIGANTPALPADTAAAPADLLSSPSFPQGYNPNQGSFQVGAVPGAIQDVPMSPFINDAPMAEFTPDVVTPQAATNATVAAPQAKEVSKITKDGKHAIFDAETKQFLRYAE